MTLQVAAGRRRAYAGGPFLERNFKYPDPGPGNPVLLLVGLFPLIYSLIVSFQGVTMMEADTSFQGLRNYAQLFEDLRLWQSLAHTLIITAIALPIELVLGLLLAHLFLDADARSRDLQSALPDLANHDLAPSSRAPPGGCCSIINFGPINQIIAWFAGEQVPIIWLRDDGRDHGLARSGAR